MILETFDTCRTRFITSYQLKLFSSIKESRFLVPTTRLTNHPLLQFTTVTLWALQKPSFLIHPPLLHPWKTPFLWSWVRWGGCRARNGNTTSCPGSQWASWLMQRKVGRKTSREVDGDGPFWSAASWCAVRERTHLKTCKHFKQTLRLHSNTPTLWKNLLSGTQAPAPATGFYKPRIKEQD